MTREEAIRDIEECILPHVGGISLRMAIEDMKEMNRLSKAEPVLIEPDRQRGEWQQVTAKDGEYYFYHECTNCGQTIESGFDNPPLFNYCPNCGAWMRKEGGEK